MAKAVMDPAETGEHLSDGCDDEFSAFVRARTPSLLRAAYLLTGDQHLAEDLVQSALARTHLSWKRLSRTANAEAYARKIMYHTQISFWRRRRPAESLTGHVPEAPESADQAAGIALRLAVRTALDKLTPKQRAILVLRYFEDRSEAETARLLNVSVGTVKSQTSHALDRMRALAPELGAVADEARPVDLEPRIARTARRRRHRRAGAAAAVAVLIVAIAWAAVVIRPIDDRMPAGPTPTVTTSVQLTPSAETATIPPASGRPAAYGCPGVPTQPVASADIPGELHFWTYDEAAGCALLSRLSGGQVRVVATVPLGDSFGPVQTVVLSPDATRVAWVTNDTTESQTGDLAVATIGATEARTLGGQVFYAGGSTPRWEPDSRHLVVLSKDDGYFRIDTDNGASGPVTPPVGYIRYSPNGQTTAYGAEGTIVVVTGDTQVRQFPYSGPDPACGCGFSVQDVSDDGRFVVVGRGSTDPSRVVGGYVVLDTLTGQAVDLPVTPAAGYVIRQVVLGPGGGQLVITAPEAGGDGPARLHLVSAQGVVTGEADLPQLTLDGAVVRYRD